MSPYVKFLGSERMLRHPNHFGYPLYNTNLSVHVLVYSQRRGTDHSGIARRRQGFYCGDICGSAEIPVGL